MVKSGPVYTHEGASFYLHRWKGRVLAVWGANGEHGTALFNDNNEQCEECPTRKHGPRPRRTRAPVKGQAVATSRVEAPAGRVLRSPERSCPGSRPSGCRTLHWLAGAWESAFSPRGPPPGWGGPRAAALNALHSYPRGRHLLAPLGHGKWEGVSEDEAASPKRQV